MSIQEKQDYLRTEIVEKGFDPNGFYEFWQSFSLQIGEVQIQILIDIVNQFKKSAQKINRNEDQDEFGDFQSAQEQKNYYKDINWDFLAQPINKERQSPKKQSVEKSVEKSDESNPNLISIDEKKQQFHEPNLSESYNSKKVQDSLLTSKDMNVTLKEVFKQSKLIQKKCLKLQPNILDHHVNVQIFISKWQEIQDQSSNIINKLWKGKDLVFTLKTLARNKQKVVGISWQVKRRHADFEWLRSMLTKFYPGHIVPPLPSATKAEEKLGGYFRKMQGFLLDCYYCPELKNSKYFQVFLSYSSLNDFELFKKNCENNTKPKSLSHILNMKGQVDLMFSDKIDAYTNGLQQFLSTSSHHLKNVKHIILQINELYENISHKYKELSEVFRVMSSQSCQFSQEQCYPRLTQTYKQIANLTDQHSDFCLNQKQFIQTFMLSQFAYEKDRIDNIQNLITKRKTFCVEYAKPKHQNEGKKPQPSMFGKIAGLFGQKSESLEVPSPQTDILREQVGFFNSQLMKESVRTIERMISSHVNHFSLYGHSRIDNVDAMQKIWSEVMVELSKLHSR